MFLILRFAAIMLGFGLSFFVLPTSASAQIADCNVNTIYDLYGDPYDEEDCSEIVAAGPPYMESETDQYTVMDYYLEAEGYTAYVEGTLSENGNLVFDDQAFDDGTGNAELVVVSGLILGATYTLDGYHEVDDPFGDPALIDGTEVVVFIDSPHETGISPRYGFVGTYGSVILQGSGLVDPFTGFVQISLNTGTGMSLLGVNILAVDDTGNVTELEVEYFIDLNASTGPRLIGVSDQFGSDSGDFPFTVGDPPPNIVSVSPPVWPAGSTNLNITISGTGFGTNPVLTIPLANGVTSYSQGNSSDTTISATVSIASNAQTGPTTVTVTSTGYNGTVFQPAYDGEPSSSTFGVQIQANTLGPAPTIFLYGTTNVTNQTTNLVIGQQIALSATVTLPQGVTIQSQSWSNPAGAATGGYTNASGSAPCLLATNCPPPDTTGGKILAVLSSTDANFTFYWLEPFTDKRQITYQYLASDGTSNSATAEFTIGGVPTSPSPSMDWEPLGTVNIVPAGYNPDFHGAPGLQLGSRPNLPAGIAFTASPTLQPGQGAYSFAQLINYDTNGYIFPPPANRQTCVPSGFYLSSSPELDNVYPYPGTSYTATDSPGQALITYVGETARSFSATMYLLWTPQGDSRCPSGNACVIPVPLGSVSWQYFADATNTLVNQTNGTTWIPSSGQGPNGQYAGLGSANEFQDNIITNQTVSPFGYPIWTATSLNSQNGGTFVNKINGGACGQ
jgi:hypothetical protein